MKTWEQWGEVTIESVNRGGRPQALSSLVCAELLIYLDERPTAYVRPDSEST